MEKHPNAFCPKCGSEKLYSKHYDAFYCELCNVWLEEKCEDQSCDICPNRPDTPSKIQNA